MVQAATQKELREMYDFVGFFSQEGLALVRKGKEFFHIHVDGTPAYEQRYDDAGPFSEGLARVIKDGECFHIHTDGTKA